MKRILLPAFFCALLLISFILIRYFTDNNRIFTVPDQAVSIPSTSPSLSPSTTPSITPTISAVTSTPVTPTKIVEAKVEDMDRSNEVLSYTALDRNMLKELLAGTIVDVSQNKEALVEIAFYYEKLDEAIKERIQGKSYKDNCTVPHEDLRYVRVLYYGFDGNTRIGELIVNKQIAKDITDIFLELYLSDYPIEQMVLIDDYNADDEASMEANNTSAFNYRTMTGSSNNLSKHALGMAIDINPLYNPYVKVNGSHILVSPNISYEYQDRTLNIPYYIAKDNLCYDAFIKRGFTWGGSWTSIKDYQHFEKTLTDSN